VGKFGSRACECCGREFEANVAGVSQQGMATAFKKEPLLEGQGYSGGAMPPTGSRGTYNAAMSGPGSLRTTYKSGSQQQYGAANPGAVNRAPDRQLLDRGETFFLGTDLR
jgi:hypothetical protein